MLVLPLRCISGECIFNFHFLIASSDLAQHCEPLTIVRRLQWSLTGPALTQASHEVTPSATDRPIVALSHPRR